MKSNTYMSKYAKAFVMIGLMAMPSAALSQGEDEKPKKQLSAVGIEHGLELYDKDKSDYCVPGALQIRVNVHNVCLLYTSPSPRDGLLSRMPSSA